MTEVTQELVAEAKLVLAHAEVDLVDGAEALRNVSRRLVNHLDDLLARATANLQAAKNPDAVDAKAAEPKQEPDPVKPADAGTPEPDAGPAAAEGVNVGGTAEGTVVKATK